MFARIVITVDLSDEEEAKDWGKGADEMRFIDDHSETIEGITEDYLEDLKTDLMAKGYKVEIEGA
jgi:hypothetical protein